MAYMSATDPSGKGFSFYIRHKRIVEFGLIVFFFILVPYVYLSLKRNTQLDNENSLYAIVSALAYAILLAGILFLSDRRLLRTPGIWRFDGKLLGLSLATFAVLYLVSFLSAN